MNKKETSLTVFDGFAVPALSGDIGRAFKDEMDGLTVDFDRVKIPSGGGLAFELPGEDEDDYETEKTITGIIVDQHSTNAYWADSYAGGNAPPDCSSMDGKSGIDKAGATHGCAGCPNNQWGSDLKQDGSFGRGKACKNSRRIYILREGEMFPLLLTLPPTSLKNFGNFLAKRVLARDKLPAEVITEVSLKKATSGDGISYSQAKFKIVGLLSEEKVREVRKYAESIQAFTRRLAIGAEDYDAGSGDEDDIM